MFSRRAPRISGQENTHDPRRHRGRHRPVPQLDDHGIGSDDGHRCPPKAERDAVFVKDRAPLLGGTVECDEVCQWLANKVRITTPIERHGRCGLKHTRERETGTDGTDGVFIAAAIRCGFACKLATDRPNVRFGISGRSLGAEK